MITLLDGPRPGTTLALRCAPHFLRVVVASDGKMDALDQPLDVPEPDETLYGFCIVQSSWSCVYVRPGGRFEMGEYRHLGALEPSQEVMRDRSAWHGWVRAYGNEAAEAIGLAGWTETPV